MALNTIVLSERARQLLEPLLGEDAELLPAYDADGADLWAVQPWRRVDALDEERSETQRFESSGRIMDVRRWALRAEAVERCGASACRSSPPECWSPARWYRRSLPLGCTGPDSGRYGGRDPALRTVDVFGQPVAGRGGLGRSAQFAAGSLALAVLGTAEWISDHI